MSIFAGSEAGIYKLAGVEGSRSYQFHFASDELALGEMVAFKAVGKGIFGLSMLEFVADKGEWTVWSGKAATTPHNLSAEGLLKRTALTSKNPAITVDKNQKLAMVKTKQLRVAVSHSTFLESGSLYVRCHDCKVDILHENFVLHTTRIHGYIPVSVGRRISGRLILKKDDPAAK